jgi:outer membrane protein TolC
MNFNIFSVRLFITFLIRLALILAAAFYFFLLGARAQNAQPSPTPAVSTLPKVDDKQNVQPENLQGVPTIAPTYKFENRNLPDLGRVGVDMLLQRSMTLRDALEMALSNNKDIEIARQNTRIAEFDLTAARGVYQPRTNVQSFYERSETPTASTILGGASGKLTQSNFAANATFTALEPKFGGNFTATFNNSRLTSTSPVNTLNPQFLTGLNLQYTQPLFRGRRFDQNRRTIEIARKNLSLSDAQFRQRTIEIITNVQRAYWDLTFALKNLQVQRDAVRDAKEQLEHNQRLVNEGLLAPIDVVAAQTQVANFEQNVYDALNTAAQAENNLKNLIAKNRDDALWTQSLIPTDPVEAETPAIELSEALSQALANRPELEQNRVAKEINSIDQRFYREQKKPQIDFVANYNLSGLAGTGTTGANIFSASSVALTQNFNALARRTGNNDLIIPPQQAAALPGNLTGGYFSSFENLLAFRYPTFRVGVNINLPFESRTAQAQYGRSLVEGERVNTQREQLEQAIQVDVRNSLQFVRTAQARLRAAAISRENSEKQYESEKRKLDAGQSTVFLVLERQTALTVARGAELRAQTELNKAIADLQRATGNSLRANNIVASSK